MSNVYVDATVGALVVSGVAMSKPFLSKAKRCWICLGILIFIFYRAFVVFERENLFSILEIPTSSTTAEIRMAARKMMKRYHPDIDGYEDNRKLYSQIMLAKEVLTNEKRKDEYNRFGDITLDAVDDNMYLALTLLSAAYQTLMYVLGYILTLPAPSNKARMIFAPYTVISFFFEVCLRLGFQDFSLNSVPIFGSLLSFEKILFSRALFPGILCASICWSNYAYVDIESNTKALMTNIILTARVALQQSEKLWKSTEEVKSLLELSRQQLQIKYHLEGNESGKNQFSHRNSAEDAEEAEKDKSSSHAAKSSSSTLTELKQLKIPTLSELEKQNIEGLMNMENMEKYVKENAKLKPKNEASLLSSCFWMILLQGVFMLIFYVWGNYNEADL